MDTGPDEYGGVNRAILRGLEDASGVLRERTIEVEMELLAEASLATHDRALESALRTLMGILPRRIAAGGSLRVRTVDRAGGDIELVIEVTGESVADEGGTGDPRDSLKTGLLGDLLDVALSGLQAVCRARGGVMAVAESSRGEREGRRYVFLIPSLTRGAVDYPPGEKARRGA